MISKQDILDRATEWQLRPSVVEKDYVLGWVLSAIATHPVTKDLWVFKGGTSIKKCYFETYRFSEDLDFSLLPGAPYTKADIKQVLKEVTDSVSQLSGIVFPDGLTKVNSRHDKLNRPTFEGKIAYQGPLGQTRSLPRIVFDITNNEPLLSQTTRRKVIHAYPDPLPENEGVLTYSLDELMAEKTRALFERTRPRDLYDVVYLLENRAEAIDFTQLRILFKKKCEVKNVAAPTAEDLTKLVHGNQELVADWEHMLAHQLPALPKLEDFLGRLQPLIQWINEAVAAPPPVEVLPTISASGMGAGQAVVNPVGIQYWGGGVPLETIRFAGANRLLVEFYYSGKHRKVEPYSLRRANTGNLLLYAWEISSSQIKAFNVEKISSLQTTDASFTPRYIIEFTQHGPISAPAMNLPRSYPSYVGIPSAPRPRSTRVSHGPTYVYECTYCGKKFKRKQRSSTLKPHKDKSGYNCSGRHAYYVDTEWN